MAKNSKYSVEIEDFIARNYAIGLPLNRIARALGIKESTVSSWTQRKKSLRVKIAELELAEAARRMQGVPDTWWLERKFPGQYCRYNKGKQLFNLAVQMLVEARTALEAAPGLDDCQVIEAESTETCLIECKTESAEKQTKEDNYGKIWIL